MRGDSRDDVWPVQADEIAADISRFGILEVLLKIVAMIAVTKQFYGRNRLSYGRAWP